MIDLESEKKEVAQEREQQIKNMPHPYLKELDICDQLVQYVTSLKVKFGLIADSEAVARQVDSEMRKAEITERNN